MVKQRRDRLVAGGGLALLLVLGYFWFRPARPAATPAAAAGRRTEARGPVGPPIGLDRLGAAPVPAEPAAERDLFGFGVEPTPPPTPPPPTRATENTEPTPPPIPTPPPLPPLNVKYIGSLEAKPGIRVAIFQTEKKDIVTGQVGEVVMNRFKVVKIGYESADIQEVGVDQVRRLPLRGGS
jgi:hypothetical protein